jgi:hypothetical protein
MAPFTTPKKSVPVAKEEKRKGGKETFLFESFLHPFLFTNHKINICLS